MVRTKGATKALFNEYLDKLGENYFYQIDLKKRQEYDALNQEIEEQFDKLSEIEPETIGKEVRAERMVLSELLRELALHDKWLNEEQAEAVASESLEDKQKENRIAAYKLIFGALIDRLKIDNLHLIDSYLNDLEKLQS